MKALLLPILLFFAGEIFSQPDTIRVHFLYGSKPAKGCREEPKWFGGIHGGHAGIEIDSGRVLNFHRNGKLHIGFGRKKDRHSHYVEQSFERFYECFGEKCEQMKRLEIVIPVTEKQKHILDSIQTAYLKQPPYDYAFLGMRCGAATYDLLQQAGIVRHRSKAGIVLRIFYPKKIRKRLLRKAKEGHWHVMLHEGSSCRKWEKD